MTDNPEISLIRTKSTGTDFRFLTDARFSNPENSFIRKYQLGTNVSCGLTSHQNDCRQNDGGQNDGGQNGSYIGGQTSGNGSGIQQQGNKWSGYTPPPNPNQGA